MIQYIKVYVFWPKGVYPRDSHRNCFCHICTYCSILHEFPDTYTVRTETNVRAPPKERLSGY